MKIEEQVTSLELSKRLKELGVKQESLFWWLNTGKIFDGEDYPDAWSAHFDEEETENEQAISAFTAVELGKMIPRNYGSSLLIELRKNGWLFRVPGFEVLDKSEANARAKLLIFLIENQHIKV